MSPTEVAFAPYCLSPDNHSRDSVASPLDMVTRPNFFREVHRAGEGTKPLSSGADGCSLSAWGSSYLPTSARRKY